MTGALKDSASRSRRDRHVRFLAVFVVLVVLLVVPVGLLVPIDVEAVGAAQVVAIDEPADLASLAGAGFLVEAEVNPAVDTRIVDVVRDFVRIVAVVDLRYIREPLDWTMTMIL